MNGNKTIREIWNVTNQSSTDLVLDNERELERIRNFNEIDSSSKNEEVRGNVNDPKNAGSYYTYFGNQYPNNFLNTGCSGNLINFQEEENTSDQSIWTPTVNDDFKKSLNQQFYPYKERKNTPSSQYVCETEKSDEDDFQDCYETKYSELNDEINEQTFGENADPSSQSELSLKDISETTEASHKYLRNASTPKNTINGTRYKTTVYSQKCYQTLDLENDKDMHTESETLIKKLNQRCSLENKTSVKKQEKDSIIGINDENVKQKYRNPRRKLYAKFSHFSSDSTTMIHESSTAHNSSKHPKENSPKFSRTTTVKTKEVFGEGGSIRHRTVEKTVYIQGKKVDKVKETLKNEHDRKIIWNSNICLFETGNEHFNRSSNRRTSNQIESSNRNFSHNRHNFKGRTDPKFRNNFQRKIMEDNYFEVNKNANVHDKFKKQSDYEVDSENKKQREAVRMSYKELNDSSYDSSKKQIPTADIINFDEQEENNTVTHQTSKNEFSNLTYINESEYCSPREEKNRMTESFKETTQNKLYCDAVEDKNKKKDNPPTTSYRELITTTEINPKSEKLVEEKHYLEKNNDFQKVPFLGNPNSQTNSMKNEREKVIEGLKHAKEDVDQKITSDKAKLRSILINNGKQLADFIIESQRGYESFKSFYDEWIDVRNQSIVLLEQIVDIIEKSKKSITIRNVLQAVNIAANLAANVPHPGVAAGARLVAGVAGVFGKWFQFNDSPKDEINNKEFHIRRIFQRDMDTSSSVYIKGVMCGTQFEETCRFMKTFNEKLVSENYWFCFDDTDVLEFFDEISVYNTSNPFAFYKRLKLLYERLIQNSKTDESKYFIRVFEDVPEAVGVVDFLPWRFDSDGFDNSIVQNAWDDLFEDFDHSETANIDAFSRKIKNCLYFLKKEQDLLIRSCRELFK